MLNKCVFWSWGGKRKKKFSFFTASPSNAWPFIRFSIGTRKWTLSLGAVLSTDDIEPCATVRVVQLMPSKGMLLAAGREENGSHYRDETHPVLVLTQTKKGLGDQDPVAAPHCKLHRGQRCHALLLLLFCLFDPEMSFLRGGLSMTSCSGKAQCWYSCRWGHIKGLGSSSCLPQGHWHARLIIWVFLSSLLSHEGQTPQMAGSEAKTTEQEACRAMLNAILERCNSRDSWNETDLPWRFCPNSPPTSSHQGPRDPHVAKSNSFQSSSYLTSWQHLHPFLYFSS